MAWRSLTPFARSIYVQLAQRYNGRNNGAIGLSQRDAASLCGMSKVTARKALLELQDRGFVELAKQGAFSIKLRHAAEWRLTAFRDDVTGAPASKAFMRWRPARD